MPATTPPINAPVFVEDPDAAAVVEVVDEAVEVGLKGGLGAGVEEPSPCNGGKHEDNDVV